MIKNRKYIKNKTNQGIIPTLTDKRIEYIPTKCGKCIECRKQYAREWQIRLMEEIKSDKRGKFITLTFSNESIKKLNDEQIKRTNKETGEIQSISISNLKGYDRDNATATKATHLFRERYRKHYKHSPKHWLVTELGHNGTENIHMHGIIWTNETYKTIRDLWQYGYIYPRPETKEIMYVNNKTINYLIKYITKVDQRNKEYKSKILTSPGIGKDYIKTINARKHEFRNKETREYYTTETGHKIALPTYYRNKLYTDQEKEQLWINKLDKQERYVLGQKIDISKNQKEYNDAVKYARQLNKELGYGQRTNENRLEYENQRREIMILTRIKNAK